MPGVAGGDKIGPVPSHNWEVSGPSSRRLIGPSLPFLLGDFLPLSSIFLFIDLLSLPPLWTCVSLLPKDSQPPGISSRLRHCSPDPSRDCTYHATWCLSNLDSIFVGCTTETAVSLMGKDILATTHRLPYSTSSNLETSRSSWLTGCKVGQYWFKLTATSPGSDSLWLVFVLGRRDPALVQTSQPGAWTRFAIPLRVLQTDNTSASKLPTSPEVGLLVCTTYHPMMRRGQASVFLHLPFLQFFNLSELFNKPLLFLLFGSCVELIGSAISW
jgi:hypothetical protein